MFLTQHETATIKVFGAACKEATLISVGTMIETYNFLRPYGEQVKIIAMHVAAFTIAFCHLSYRWLQPRVMQVIDAIVESGYAKCSESDTESQPKNTGSEQCQNPNHFTQLKNSKKVQNSGVSSSIIATCHLERSSAPRIVL